MSPCAITRRAAPRLLLVAGAAGLAVLLDAALPSSLLASPSTIPAWGRVSITPREDFTLVFDPTRNRLVLFGGWDGTKDLDETWVLSLATEREWVRILDSGPAARRGHVAIYDPVGDRMVVYGGQNETFDLTDVWSLSLGTLTWSRLGSKVFGVPLGTDYSAVYDPHGERMVVFGGEDGGTFSNGIWAYNLAAQTWTILAPVGPSPTARARHTAIYDSARQRMVMYGGDGTDIYHQPVLYGDTWALSLNGVLAWSQVSTSGGYAHTDHCAVYDASRDEMVTFGGQTASSYDHGWAWRLRFSDNTWDYDAATDYESPIRSSVAAAAAITDANRMIVVGGRASATYRLSDAFFYPLSWQDGLAGLTAATPAPLVHQAGAWDPTLSLGITQGGWYGETAGAAWRFDAEGTPSTMNAGPAAYGAAAIHDPIGNRFIVFGGVFQMWAGAFASADVWASPIPYAGWIHLAPSGTAPAARFDHSAVYDPARQRMIVLGGRQYPWSASAFSDLWALELSGPLRWTALTPANAGPVARFGHRAVLDPEQDRMFVYGGRSSEPLSDVWELDLQTLTWTERTPAGPAPTARAWPSLTLDTRRGRAILFGGQDESGGTDDTWTLDLRGTLAWTELVTGTAPEPRYGHVAFYDEASDRMMLQGGAGSAVYPHSGAALNDTWVLQLEDAVDVPATLPSRIRVAAVAPNPARHASSIVLDLPAAAAVSIEIVDLAGRRVRDVARENAAAGRHRFEWDGRTSDGRRTVPGLYFYRVAAGAERFARKVLVTR